MTASKRPIVQVGSPMKMKRAVCQETVASSNELCYLSFFFFLVGGEDWTDPGVRLLYRPR